MLPFRRTRLNFSALVMGSFAPDFLYFLNMAPHGEFGHTPLGMFLFSLPAALVALWMFHHWVKPVAFVMLPRPWRERLAQHLGPFAFGPAPRFLLLAVSALAGIATHIGWDSFTHPSSPLVQHWAALRAMHTLPLLGTRELCRILQLISTLVGLGIVAAWLAAWYRRARPVVLTEHPAIRRRRVLLWIGLPLGAATGALLRVWIGLGNPLHHLGYGLVLFVIAAIAMVWWELVIVGYLADSSGELNQHSCSFNALLTAAPDTDK